ncbi:MAG TPA: ATP-binding cassette domain-containing protein [Candidatus Babeliales bacterium]|jgi:ABC-type polar amino acid transport system ATPase subunit|nr:ATP-binding cassette domain-containing protein [Candidatus Babeliales bacterium]
MLKINHLNKSFKTKKILNNISLTVQKSEIALFLGSSGVGKSTLLRILNNLETVDSGTIFLNDAPLDLTTINTTHTVGMVFQQFNLFDHLTVEQNITLPIECVLKKSASEAQKITQKLLDRYGLLDQKNKYASQLSGGQKQRLAIARALAMEPKIICLDEPTSALDPVLTSYVASNIQQLATDGYIVLVASHDTDLLRKLNCTIYLMSEGAIVETADSRELCNNPDAFPRIKKFIAGHE